MENNDHEGIRSFRDLVCWQLARELVRDVYGFTAKPEFRRDFTLVDQSRRSATSILFNISEGFERDGNREFLNFLSIAKGSCGELESALIVASDQRYISRDELTGEAQKIRRCSKVIAGLMRHLRDSPLKGPKFKKPNHHP
jgi:four helix bundle protein